MSANTTTDDATDARLFAAATTDDDLNDVLPGGQFDQLYAVEEYETEAEIVYESNRSDNNQTYRGTVTVAQRKGDTTVDFVVDDGSGSLRRITWGGVVEAETEDGPGEGRKVGEMVEVRLPRPDEVTEMIADAVEAQDE